MLHIILNLIQKASKQNLFYLPIIILRDSVAIWTSDKFSFFPNFWDISRLIFQQPVDIFWYNLVFFLVYINTNYEPNFIKIWDGEKNGCVDLTWNDPKEKTFLRRSFKVVLHFLCFILKTCNSYQSFLFFSEEIISKV